MSNPILQAFVRSDTRPMVAAALDILAKIASDPEQRHELAAPWAWDLRQRARIFERTGQRRASAQAKVIARLVGAVALGEVTSSELSSAATAMGADRIDTRTARDVLEAVMADSAY